MQLETQAGIANFMYIVNTQQIIQEPTIDFYIAVQSQHTERYTSDVLHELDSINISNPVIKWNIAIAIKLCAAKPMRIVCPLSNIQEIVEQVNADPVKYPKLKELFSEIYRENE